MATVIIKSSTKAAKTMLEYLKTQPYAKVIEENEPNRATLRSIGDIKTGKVTRTNSVEDLLKKLKK